MLKNEHMLFADFPEVGKITPEIKKDNENRVFTGGVRIGSGMYRTDEQAEEYKEKSLQRKLP